MRKMKLSLVAAALAALIVPGAVQAEYPDKTINLWLGFGAGGNIDIAARQAQPFLEKYLGNNAKIAVINKPGAAGALMNSALAAAEPDGYTMGLLSLPGVYTVLYGSKFPYSVDSYDYLGTITSEPYTFFLNKDLPYKTLADLVAAAKAAPGKVNLSSSGVGSAPHLGLLLFQKVAGVKFNYVPFKGAAAMRSAVLGGHVVGGVSSVSLTVPMHQEGQAVVVGMMRDVRWDKAPNIPTFKEQGYDFEWYATRGIGGPKGLPADIKAKWETAIKKMHADPEFLALAARDRMLLKNSNGAEFEALARGQVKMLDDMWKTDPWM